TRVANPGPPAFSRPMATGRMSASITQPARIAHARQARLRYAQLTITTSAATAQDSCWSATGGLVITEPNDSHRHGPPSSPGTRVVPTRVDAKSAREAAPGLAAAAGGGDAGPDRPEAKTAPAPGERRADHPPRAPVPPDPPHRRYRPAAFHEEPRGQGEEQQRDHRPLVHRGQAKQQPPGRGEST